MFVYFLYFSTFFQSLSSQQDMKVEEKYTLENLIFQLDTCHHCNQSPKKSSFVKLNYFKLDGVADPAPENSTTMYIRLDSQDRHFLIFARSSKIAESLKQWCDL